VTCIFSRLLRLVSLAIHGRAMTTLLLFFLTVVVVQLTTEEIH
jgi:hypothetical protein